ncbi:right-handed parallel beta-helix repeat-containing protein [Bowmanella denitrificans]|uniref:Right-handed parallel beta-helix repeat-containing protein n=1 Tax=Bowmanella denitrificans TaxID=366582 RepID=A0ABP3H3Z6_9ALTE
MKILFWLFAITFSLTSAQVNAADCNSGIYKLYMSTNGNDANEGTSNLPLASLNGVKNQVELDRPNCDVEIHIKKGLYRGQSVVWKYTNDHQITFTAADFGGQYDRPEFVSDGSSNAALWFDLQAKEGKWSNIQFRYIRVKGYWGGIRLFGNRDDKLNGWNGRNEILGMVFENIGGKYHSYNGRKGYAAINAFNSRENIIRNSHFINIENSSNCPGCMHGVYLAHYSSNNYVDRNVFRNISGNPVQNRDESNSNRYEYNTFERSGYVAQVQDWYCTGSECTKPGGECPSHSVLFANNTYGTLYNGVKQLKVWDKPGSDNYCGTLPAARIRTAYNTPSF